MANPELAQGAAELLHGAAGAAPEALRSPDTLDEDRWPAYTAAALARGVRCCGTLVHRSGPVMVTLTLFGARPGQPCPQDQPLGRLAAVFGGAAPGLGARPPGAIGS
jgi:hypothetical protein